MEKFTEQLKALSERTLNLKDTLNTEEATKTALVMPFFQLLGYDVFNPLEFSPEFTADVGIKKGEKVDYAILEDNEPVILIECKSVNEKLDNHDSQLFRYFGTTTSKFGILTNGVEYRFYTDLDEQNKMDSSPFLRFNLCELKDNHIVEIFKFTKENFDVTKEGVALVDFWAPWCGPCRMLAPVIEELAEDFDGKAKICKVNTDEVQDLAVEFGIRSIPTLLFFKNGDHLV